MHLYQQLKNKCKDDTVGEAEGHITYTANSLAFCQLNRTTQD